MLSAIAKDSLRRQRNRLVVERNGLYDTEATISAAGRVLIRTEGDPAAAELDVLQKDVEDVRVETEAIQQRIDRIDRLRGAHA